MLAIMSESDDWLDAVEEELGPACSPEEAARRIVRGKARRKEMMGEGLPLKRWRARCFTCIESGSGFDPAEGPLEHQAEGVRQVLGFTESLEGRPLFALQSAAFAAGQDHGWGNVGPQEAIHTGRMLALRWLRQELGEEC